MKFYDCQTAPSPRRVRMFIAEKEIEIPVIQVDLRNREQLSDDFRKINPRCTVPVLELFMEILDRRLAVSSYVALDRFTMADIGAYVCVDFANWVKLPVGEQWPNIRRWCGEIASRPSATV